MLQDVTTPLLSFQMSPVISRQVVQRRVIADIPPASATLPAHTLGQKIDYSHGKASGAKKWTSCGERQLVKPMINRPPVISC